MRGVVVSLVVSASAPRPKWFLPKVRLLQARLATAPPSTAISTGIWPTAHPLPRDQALPAADHPQHRDKPGEARPGRRGAGTGPRQSPAAPLSAFGSQPRVRARSRPHAVLCLDSADPGTVTLASSGGEGHPLKLWPGAFHFHQMFPPEPLSHHLRVALSGATCKPQLARVLRDLGTLRTVPSGSSQFRRARATAGPQPPSVDFASYAPTCPPGPCPPAPRRRFPGLKLGVELAPEPSLLRRWKNELGGSGAEKFLQPGAGGLTPWAVPGPGGLEVPTREAGSAR